jgi:hypothetical protein
MSYRNDHDAAIARIDALEAELSRARDDHGADAARAELDRLEAEIRRARDQRDRLQREIEDATPKPKRRAWAVVLAVLLATKAIARRDEPIAAEPPPNPVVPPRVELPPPSPSRSATRLVECAKELDRAIADGTASSDACIGQLRLAAADPVLGDDVHSLLQRWLDTELAIVGSPNTHTVSRRTPASRSTG